MIVVKLIGGLGNQMFQYALGRSLALHRNEELLLDHSFFNEIGSHTPREYECGIFHLDSSIASDELLRSFDPSRFSLLKNLLLEKFLGSHVKRRLNEKSHAFQSEVFDAKGDLHLVGYWQTEKYFLQFEKEIRRDFEFARNAEGRNAELLLELSRLNGVSIHIRRGDYVTNTSANDFHGLCSLEYYSAGIEYVLSRVPDATFYVFSDDIEWARLNIRIPAPTIFIDHNQGRSSWEDMRLMSQCQHHIIANSSFSWWGAWLNPSPDKIVIAPSKWFADSSIPTDDIVPSTWIRI